MSFILHVRPKSLFYFSRFYPFSLTRNHVNCNLDKGERERERGKENDKENE